MSDELRRLRAGGSALAKGRLSLDAEHAREKMRQFQLSDPFQYVLHLVRCASIAGATRIDFQIDADEVELRFDAGLEPDRLVDLWNVGLAEPQSAVGALAAALGTAMGLGMAEIRVASWTSGRLVRLEIRDGDEVSDIAEGDPPAGVETTVYLRERFRLGHLRDFFRKFDGDLAEVHHIREKCAWTSIPIRINGDLANRRALMLRADAGSRPGAGVVLSEERWLRIHLVRDGVEIGEWHTDEFGGGEGWVESTALQTDLTGLAAVRDPRFETIARSKSLDAYFRAVRLEAASLPRERLAKDFVWAVEQSHAAEARALAKALESEPLWPRGCGAGGLLSVKQVAAGARQLPYVTRRFPFETDVSPVLLAKFTREEWRRMLGALQRHTGRFQTDVTEGFRAEEEARAARERWLARPVLGAPDAPHRVRLEGAPEVWLTVSSILDAGGNAFVRRRSAGRALRMKTVREGLICIDVDGEVEPNASCTDYSDPMVLAEPMVRILDVLPAFVAEVATGWHAEPPSRRPLAVRWLAALAQGEFHRAVAASLFEGSVPAAAERRLRSVAARHAFYGVGRPRIETSPRGEVEERLGPLATLPMFATLAGWASFVDLVSEPSLLWLDSADDHSDLIEGSQSLDTFVPARFVLCDAAELRALNGIFGYGIRSGRSWLVGELGRRRFLRRPTRPESDERGLARLPRRQEAGGALMDVVLRGTLPRFVVEWVREGRVLGRSTLPPLRGGDVLVTFWDDELPPNSDWSDVSKAMRVEALEGVARQLHDEVHAKFLHEVARRGRFADADEARVFYRWLAQFADDGADMIDEPLLTLVDVGAEQPRRQVSLREVREAIGRGHPIVVCAGDAPTRLDDWVWCIDLKEEVPDAVVSDLLGTSEWLHAGPISRPPSETDDAEFVSPVPEAQTIRVVGERVELLMWEPERPSGKDGVVAIDVLFGGRKVETLYFPVIFGRSRGLARGDAIAVDRSMERVVAGYRSIAVAVREADEKALSAALDRHERRPAPDPQRLDLLAALGRARERGDAFVAASLRRRLELAPLFRTGGGWVSYREVRALAASGVIGYSPWSTEPDTLLMASHERSAHESALDDVVLVRRAARKVSAPIVGESKTVEAEAPDEVGTKRPPPDAFAPPLRIHDPRLGFAQEVGTVVQEILPQTSFRVVTAGPEDVLVRSALDHTSVNVEAPIFSRLMEEEEVGALLLASLVSTSLNAKLGRFTDQEESAAQRSLLKRLLRAADAPGSGR